MKKYATLDELFADMQRFVEDTARNSGSAFHVEGGAFRVEFKGMEDILPGVDDLFGTASRFRAARPTPTRTHDAWAVLGVARGADDASVKAAYRKLAHRWHPDRPGGNAAKMAAINAAYEEIQRGDI